jgi:hypothetical protein
MSIIGVIIIIAAGIVFTMISFAKNKGKERWKIIIPILNTILEVIVYQRMPYDSELMFNILFAVFGVQIMIYCIGDKCFQIEPATIAGFIMTFIVSMFFQSMPVQEVLYNYDIIEKTVDVEQIDKESNTKGEATIEFARDSSDNKTFVEVIKMCQTFDEEMYKENCRCTDKKICRFCELSTTGTKYVIHLPKG